MRIRSLGNCSKARVNIPGPGNASMMTLSFVPAGTNASAILAAVSEFRRQTWCFTCCAFVAVGKAGTLQRFTAIEKQRLEGIIDNIVLA